MGRASYVIRVVARLERAVFSAPPPVATEASQASLENCLNNNYSQFVFILCRRGSTLALTPRARV